MMIANRFVLFAIGVCALVRVGDASERTRPNVILIMCDDLGWGDPPCFNPASPIAMPHLDAMAANGLKFRRFYAAAPVCSPTRGSCLTGRHPDRYGIYFANVGHLKRNEVTIAECLRPIGYATGFYGKWHLGTLTTEVRDSNRGGPDNAAHFSPPNWHGFDTYFATEAKVPTFDPMLMPRDQNGIAWDALVDRATAIGYGTHYWAPDGMVAAESLDGDDSALIMDRALTFVETAVAGAKPFFAVVWLHAPHLPVVAAEHDRHRYAQFDVHRRNYYGCITALDRQLGRLRRRLRELDVADNTLVWFGSDNGPEGNADAPGSTGGLRGRKRSLYEGGVRVPAVLEWPQMVPACRVTDFPAVTSDLLPTILAAIELSLPDDRPLDGISLLPVIRRDVDTRGRPIAFASRQQKALIDDRYKLVQTAGTWQLYDLVKDPSETQDLASSQPERVAAMQAQWNTWRASCQRSQRGVEDSLDNETR